MSSTSIGESLNAKQSCINEFRLQGILCDVKIKVGERSFHCHRVILASAFKYFRDMFTKNFIEAQQEEIELKNVSADDFELLLNRIYDVPVNLSVGDNAFRLLRINHYLHLECLEDLYAHYISNVDSFPLKTVVNIYRFAMRTDEEVLSNGLANHLARNFIVAVQTCSDTLECCSEDELFKIFAQPAFDTNADFALLDFLTRWVSLQPSKGKKILSKLLNSVDLAAVPKEWIVKMMNNSGDKTEKGIERRHADSEVDVYQSELLLIDMDPGRNRRVSKLPFIFYTLDDNQDNNSPNLTSYGFINKYKLESSNNIFFLDSILRGNSSQGHVINFKAAVVDQVHLIMVNFGKYRKQILSPVICTDSGTRKLKEWDLAYNPDDRITMVASGVEMYVYTYDSLRIYNCEIDSWTSSSFVYPSVRYSNLVSHDDVLYLIGGHTGTGETGKQFKRYDKRENKWSPLSCTKYAHIRSSSCVHNSVLYVSGGEGLTSCNGYIECYDFRAGRWNEFESSLPCPKFDHTSIAYDNKLWFFGGSCYEDPSTTEPKLTWCSYDMNEHEWSDNHPIQTRVHRKFTIEDIHDVIVQI